MNLVFIYSTPDSARYVLVRGNVGGWFRSRRIPALRTNLHNGWWLSMHRVDDVIVDMGLSGLHVTYREGTAPRWVPPAPASQEAA